MKGAVFTQLCSALSGPQPRADLHTHTDFSDGDLSPEELVLSAVRNQLSALSITDHDTTAAIPQAQQAIAAYRCHLKLIHGVEITCEIAEREFHLLAYGFELGNATLQSSLHRLREGRFSRLQEMIAALIKLGASSELNLLTRNPSTEQSWGRRHLAQALVKLKASRNLYHAFQHWLNRPEVIRIPKIRLALEEAIAIVRQAGGIPILAHPPEDLDENFFAQWKQRGLMGLECDYPWPSRSRSKILKNMASQLGLLATGGSDFHSTHSPRRAVGMRTVSISILKDFESRS